MRWGGSGTGAPADPVPAHLKCKRAAGCVRSRTDAMPTSSIHSTENLATMANTACAESARGAEGALRDVEVHLQV